jgi:hypothetical protein
MMGLQLLQGQGTVSTIEKVDSPAVWLDTQEYHFPAINS